MKMTPWFPPEIRPVRVGEYQCDSSARRWWDGESWSCMYFPDEPRAIKLAERQQVSCYQEIQWRGLAEEPK